VSPNGAPAGRRDIVAIRLAPPPQLRHIEQRLAAVGIHCRPEVSLHYQSLAKRYVLRGIESGGASGDLGRFVTFSDEEGQRLSWLMPLDSVAANARHAAVVRESLVAVEAFRVKTTYEVLVVRYSLMVPDGRTRPRIHAELVFRGHDGHLPLDLTGSDKGLSGKIAPEFFTRAGDRRELPTNYVEAIKAAVAGANCLSCRHQHFVIAPQPATPPLEASPQA
jgi:hypothetical protein